MQSHDSMVRSLVNHLAQDGFTNIHADLPDNTQPAKITWTETGEGHIPDVTVLKAGREHVFEVETADSLTDGHTEDQLRLFGAYAHQHGATCCLVVPKGSKMAANTLLAQINVAAEIWTIG